MVKSGNCHAGGMICTIFLENFVNGGTGITQNIGDLVVAPQFFLSFNQINLFSFLLIDVGVGTNQFGLVCRCPRQLSFHGRESTSLHHFCKSNGAHFHKNRSPL